MNELDFVKTYLTHSELLGFRYPKDDLINHIRSMEDVDSVLSIVSQFSYIPNYDQSITFKSDLIKIISQLASELATLHRGVADQMVTKAADLLKKRSLLFDQSLLNLWKYMLAYAEQSSHEEPSIDSSYRKTIWLLLCLSDYYSEPGYPIEQEIFRNFAFNRHRDFGYSLGRTLLIYTHLCHDRVRFEDNFIDIGTIFEEKYGFTIETYIAVLFAIHALFLEKSKSANHLITQNWAHDIVAGLSQTKIAEVCRETLKLLTFNSKEIRESVAGAINNTWDFSMFYEKPIMSLDNGLSFPVHKLLLENSLTELLFWQARRCYPPESREFHTFFGRAFELYVQDVLKTSCEVSDLPYLFIPEQKYQTSKGQNRTPDAMVRLGERLLVVESKVARLNFVNSVIAAKREFIEKDRVRMTVSPIVQAYREVRRLLDGKNPDVNLNGIKEIYFFAVNYDEFPAFSIFESSTQTDLAKLTGIDLPVYFFHGSIEDLEMLSYLMEGRKPIFRLLKHKHRNYSQLDFRNFIYSQRIKVREPAFLKSRLDVIIEQLRHMIF